MTRSSAALLGAAACGAAAAGCYLNALSAEFAFDDHFAITYSGDVTDPNKPVAAIWRNDFWGQDIRGEGSHKSWRPLTVLTFRLNRVLSADPSKVTPRPFHATNVALHAVVSLAVHALAWRLARLRSATNPAVYATIAALLFALHPVHTEAVTGVVGRAELLSALLCIGGLLLFMSCVDCSRTATPLRFGATLAGAMGCAAAAMLAKETGFTVLGAFVLYEVLAFALGPKLQSDAAAATAQTAGGAAALPPAEGAATPSKSPKLAKQMRGDKRAARTASPASSTPPSDARRPPAATLWPHLLRCAARIVATFALAAAYLATRRAIIGGDTLVHIYRKVENPLAFYPTRAQRLLSTFHQHWLYLFLLIAPVQLSADWSFSCVAPVESYGDVRNAGSLFLYGSIVLVGLQTAPWRLQRDERLCARRVRAFVVLALLVAPFVPAANIFLYVGTFIGERLLYMPSLGFCLLLAEPLAAFCGGSATPRLRSALGWGLCLLLSAGYAGRTWVRNADWATEETLFRAALKVCPDSAKVRLNNGIIARRYEDWDGAVAHFRRAEQVEPGYCEPTYWIGLTRVNENRVEEGMELLVKALDCKWVAVEAAKVLQQIIAARLKIAPTDTLTLLTEGALLTKMEQHDRACEAFTRAASSFQAQGSARKAKAARKRCAASALAAESCVTLVEANRAKRDALLAAPPADDDARRAALSALARELVEAAGPACRSSSHVYLEAVHVAQSADAYDPFLHREWALLLQARGGRDAEALQHMSVALALFQQAAAAEASGQRVVGPHMAPATPGAQWMREVGATDALLPAEQRAAMRHQAQQQRRGSHGRGADDNDDDDEL